MNDFSCCSSCTGVSSEKVFPLGSYVPYTPGYGHTFSGMNPVGIAGKNMGIPVARPYPDTFPLPIGSIPATYHRGDGDPAPFISLPTFNGYSKTGDPATFNPLSNYAGTGTPCGFNPVSNYAGTGTPCGFNPVSGYPSPSNPVGITPVGESMPANVGHPYRVGGDAIGGLGSYFDDQPYTSETRL